MLSRWKKLLKNLCKKDLDKQGQEADEFAIEQIIKEKEN